MLFTVFRGESPQAIRLEGPRVYLLPPRMADWKAWATLREESREFLTPWEPTWPHDALTRHAFRRRLQAYSHEWRCGPGFSFLVPRLPAPALLGGLTIPPLPPGVAPAASTGPWTGGPHARQAQNGHAPG